MLTNTLDVRCIACESSLEPLQM